MTEFIPKFADLTPDKIPEEFHFAIITALHKRYLEQQTGGL